MLNVTLITPHPQTPTYLAECAHTFHRTIIDPVAAADVEKILGTNKPDLILLTSATEQTVSGAGILAERTGAPILASAALLATALPIARTLESGEIVGMGPLAQTVWIPDGDIMCYALGSENIIFTGPLFATGVLAHKPNKGVLITLQNLPEDTTACGGGAHNLPLAPLLSASQAS
jgi:glyoxylase-like metal-dependent hydrolase (beta-lactamase superfamily II)